MPRNPEKTAVMTVSLPRPLARKVEAARKAEHRTRSGVVTEALRHYFNIAPHLPEADATPSEIRALKRARRNYEAGNTVTYDEYRAKRAGRLDAAPRPRRAKAAR